MTPGQEPQSRAATRRGARPAEQRVLITGGTGFIGGALAARLIADGVGVDVLTRQRSRVERRFGARVRALESLDEIARDEVRPPPAVIVNLAGKNLGEERWNRRLKDEIVASRVRVTRHVVSYIANASQRPRLLISGSAVGYYGARGSERLTEASEAGDEFQSDLCVRWESVAETAAEYGVRTCITRTGVVLGADGGALAGLVPLFRKGLGAVVGSGRQWISWIALEDLLRLFQDFIDDESLTGVFNNTAPGPVMHRAFAQTLGRQLGKPVLLRVPAALYRLMVGEMAHLHATGQCVFPARHVERGFHYEYPDLDSALQAALGRPTTRGTPLSDRAYR